MINISIRKKNPLIFMTVLLSALFMSQCASFYHAHMMKGNILKQKGNEYYLCIGTKDGAKEGQLYNVFTYKENPQLLDTVNYLERVYIGTIKITNIVHEHYAKAVLVSGKASKYDFVELK